MGRCRGSQASSLWRALGAACVGLLAVVAACTGGTEQPPEVEEEQLPPLELSEQPAWTGSFASEVNQSVDVRGDTVIVHSVQQVAAFDAVTGTPLWTIKQGHELPAGDGAVLAADSASYVVGTDGDVMVVVEYTLEHDGGSPETGIAVLDEDGAVQRSTMIVPSTAPNSPTSELDVAITGVDETLIAVAVAPHAYAMGTPVSQDQIRTIGVSTNSGDVLWDQAGNDGQWSVALTDASVLAVESTALPVNGDPDGPAYEDSTVVALDRSTGDALWELDDHAVRGATRSYAVVSGSSGSKSGLSETVILDAASGDQVADLGVNATWCRSDEESVACLVDVGSGSDKEAHLVTFDDKSSSTVTSKAPIADDAIIRGVADGYTFVSDGSGAESQTYALDRTGNPSGPFPGSFAAMSEKYVVFATYDGAVDASPTGYAVYERL